VVTQLDRLRQSGDEAAIQDGSQSEGLESLPLGEMAPKDPHTLLVMELQTKIEVQQAKLDDARNSLRSATIELEDAKATQQSELQELRTLRAQLADRDEQMQDGKALLESEHAASARVLQLQKAVEEQTAELDAVRLQLNARGMEMDKVKDELANSCRTMALQDDSSKQELLELRKTMEEQSQEIFNLKAQLVASDGLKAQLLTRNSELQDQTQQLTRKAELQDKSADVVSDLRKTLEEQKCEMAKLKDDLFEKDLELKKLQDLPARRPDPEPQGPSPQLLMDLQSTVQAQRHELTALKVQLSESQARAAACSLELSQNDQAKVEELQGSIEDMRVELATTKAQLVTRNLELTKMEAQLVARNLELTKYEEQRAELASVKAQLMARDLKLMKQEVAMALTDAKSPSPAVASTEVDTDKEAGVLKARIAQLEAEAATQTETLQKLQEELRRRDDLLFKTPRKQLEAANDDSEPLAEQLSQLAADVLSRNDQLAEKQLARARAFLEVLRGAAWAREATPSSFKLGKFLDDLAICLELEAKKALGSPGAKRERATKSAKGSSLTAGRDPGRPASALTAPAALPAPPVLGYEGAKSPVGTLNAVPGSGALPQSVLNSMEMTQDVEPMLPTAIRRPGARSPTGSGVLDGSGSPLSSSGKVGGVPSFASSYPRHGSSTLESKIDRIANRLSGPAPSGQLTVSSLNMSATTATSSSLRSTEAAISRSNSGNSLLNPGGTSPTIYSAPD
jgi:hypothetical protein